MRKSIAGHELSLFVEARLLETHFCGRSCKGRLSLFRDPVEMKLSNRRSFHFGRPTGIRTPVTGVTGGTQST